MTEDFPGADSYRFALAEVVRQHFAESITVDPNASLLLYVTGTDDTAGVQSIETDLLLVTQKNLNLNLGGPHGSMTGNFILAGKSKTLYNYTSEHKSQAVREMAYAILSTFLEDWQKTDKSQ